MNHEWGTKRWFLSKYVREGTESPYAYFAYQLNGYQRYRHERLKAHIGKYMKKNASGNMLDIGCATGDLTAAIFSQYDFDEGVGIDFLEPAVEKAGRNHPKLIFRKGCLPELDFEDNHFDFVMACDVLYYLDEQKRKQALEEIWRVLKKDGMLFFSSCLGPRYFTVHGAKAYIEKRFHIDAVFFEYNKLYNNMVYPLMWIFDLRVKLAGDDRKKGAKYVRAMQKYGALLRNGYFQYALEMMSSLFAPLVKSVTIPRVVAQFSQRTLPMSTRSNISVLASKDSTH